MDDWEQFFVEKSRRRADKERLEDRQRLRHTVMAVAAVAAAILAAIAALVLARP